MDIEKLENYRALLDEIRDLEQKQNRLSARQEEVSDTVHGSAAAWPYTLHTVKVTGISQRQQEALSNIRYLRQQRLQTAQEQLAEIEIYLAGIEEAKMRRLISLRYVDGLSWRQVARRVYGSPGYEEAARKRVKRYLEKNF